MRLWKAFGLIVLLGWAWVRIGMPAPDSTSFELRLIIACLVLILCSIELLRGDLKGRQN